MNAHVLERRAANDRHEFIRDRLATNASLQQLRRDWLLFEHCLGDFIVEIGNLLDQIVVRLLDRVHVLLRHIGHFIGRSKLIVVGINDRLLVNDVELAACS